MATPTTLPSVISSVANAQTMNPATTIAAASMRGMRSAR